MKKILILTVLALCIGTQANTTPPIDPTALPPLDITGFFLSDGQGNDYTDGDELKTNAYYSCSAGSIVTTIYCPIAPARVVRGEFWLSHIVGEAFYYDISVTFTLFTGTVLTQHYRAYNSGLKLP